MSRDRHMIEVTSITTSHLARELTFASNDSTARGQFKCYLFWQFVKWSNYGCNFLQVYPEIMFIGC